MAVHMMRLRVDDGGPNTQALTEFMDFIKQDPNADWEGTQIGRDGGIAITLYVKVGDTICRDDSGRLWIERA